MTKIRIKMQGAYAINLHIQTANSLCSSLGFFLTFKDHACIVLFK